MSKPGDFENMSTQMNIPSAPPSYDESMLSKQPPYNPQVVHQMHGLSPSYSGYPPPIPTTTVCIPAQGAQVIVPIALGPRPAALQCPACQERIVTVVSTECQKHAHIAALVLCLLGCYLCCLFPYCMDAFKNVNHKCPNCGNYIGTYKR